MANPKIKYPFLWAWDRKMNSYTAWSERMQQEAEATNAPADAIYQNTGDVKAGWARYSELERFDVKLEIWKAVTALGYDAGPKPILEDFNVEREGRECNQYEAEKIDQINELVAAWIKEASCGDPTCDTCKVGVSLGVKALNDAFNAGYNAALGPFNDNAE